MPALELPKQHLGLLHELGTRLLDSRRPGTPLESLARGLLGGFHDLCMRTGLDGLLVELERAHPPLDPTDRASLVDHPTLVPALVERLTAIHLDAGGPRLARPGQLADCVVATLGLTVSEAADRTISLPGGVRTEVAAAIAAVVEPALAVPQMRESIIAKGKARCELRYHPAFAKITAQLDDRGMRMIKQPNLPLDAVHAVQRALADARDAVFTEVARAAIDRAQAVIAAADPVAAGRIDQPITLRLTPRDVAIRRVCDPGVPKVASAVVTSLLDTLTECAGLAWRATERVARTYAPRDAFAVGELVDHPKFGVGAVIAAGLQKIDVEFADGKHTLVHQLKK